MKMFELIVGERLRNHSIISNMTRYKIVNKFLDLESPIRDKGGSSKEIH